MTDPRPTPSDPLRSLAETATAASRVFAYEARRLERAAGMLLADHDCTIVEIEDQQRRLREASTDIAGAADHAHMHASRAAQAASRARTAAHHMEPKTA